MERQEFQNAYRNLEERMRTLAEADGDVYLPNPEPAGPVDYLLICMEPSLGHWARSADEAKRKVEAGFRNFLVGIEPMLLHFSVRRFLCEPGQNYQITDLSKGAMLVKHASKTRVERYDKWFNLLVEEIDLIGKHKVQIIAVGNAVADQLRRRGLPRLVRAVIHYSPLASAGRVARLVGHEDSFHAFDKSISHEDFVNTARDVLRESAVPVNIQDYALSRVTNGKWSESRRKLVFCYKLEFDKMKS